MYCLNPHCLRDHACVTTIMYVNKSRYHKRLQLWGRMCGRNKFLSFLVHFICGLFSIAAFLFVALLCGLIVGIMVGAYVFTLGIASVFEVIWRHLE